MASVILVIHLVLALAIIALVMLQRSEGGGLGIGGGGGMGGLATAGQTANVLTRTTAICAGLFFTTSLILAILAGTHNKGASMLDSLDQTTAPAQATGAPTTDPLPDNVDPAAPATDLPAPRAKSGDKDTSDVDSSAASSDKEVPRAEKNQPQTGAPSAPISE